jgi:hypothetical protein
MSISVINTLALQQRELRGIAQGKVEGKLDLVLKMFKLGLDVETVNILSGLDSSILEMVHSSPDISFEEAVKLYYSMIDADKT